ncbi:MAG: hypothetical protein QG673_2350 [Pseudomonadota bacterium]|nr:hypothetical protein [Pseudomonadota bacterium]
MSNKFIRKITIQNFKSIKELKDFELHNINILIGANGSGKSNFLSFFNFIHYLIQKKLGAYVAKKGKADGILTFSRKSSRYLSVRIEFEENKYKFTLVPADDNSLYFSNEHTIYTNPEDRSEKEFGDNSSHTETKLEEKLENGSDKFYHARHFVPQFKKFYNTTFMTLEILHRLSLMIMYMKTKN